MIKTDVNIEDTYSICEEDVSLKLYRELNKAFNTYIIDRIIKGDIVSLPCKVGSLYIGGTKRKRFFTKDGVSILPPDWGRTRKLWKDNPEAEKKRTILRHTNEETGGVSYRVVWSKKTVPIANKVFMSFRLTKHNKKKVSRAIIEDKREYIINKVVE